MSESLREKDKEIGMGERERENERQGWQKER